MSTSPPIGDVGTSGGKVVRKLKVFSAVMVTLVVTLPVSSEVRAGFIGELNKVCGPNFPMHANTIYGAFNHTHKISWQSDPGLIQSPTKSVWPTARLNQMGTVGLQTGYLHQLWNSGGDSSGSIYYCRVAV